MAKSNPLFIDSTKMTGDSIGTQFELCKIVLYEDEVLKLLVTNHLNEVICSEMSLNSELNYQTRVWLRHQKSFSYQFILEKGPKRILQSACRSTRAQYLILDEWMPVLPETGAIAEIPAEKPVAIPAGIPQQVRSVASLIEKFKF